MKPWVTVAFLLTIATYTAPVLGQQNFPAADAKSGEPTMISVGNPGYPPLALLANITGEVVLSLEIQKDGGVESAVVVSGHPMLAKAALESARKSRFACTACAKEVTPYLVTYSYQL